MELQKRPSAISHIRDIVILPVTVTVIIPYLIYKKEPWFIPDTFVIKLLGWILLIPGISLFFYTVYLFRKRGKGTLAPWSPTQKLIIAGPYRYCRNPMITGVLFILIGEALILHSESILIWSGIFFLINTVYFIYVEEPSMYRRFGEDYLLYKKRVSRWIPRFPKD